MAKLDDATVLALAGIASQVGTLFNVPAIGTVANVAASLASLLDGNGPTAEDVAKELRAAVKAHEARVFAKLDQAAGDGDDGA